MKASELIAFLGNTINECGHDPDIYFDTEAASFDYHLIEITKADDMDDLTDEKRIVVLKCDNKFYKHIETT